MPGGLEGVGVRGQGGKVGGGGRLEGCDCQLYPYKV